MKVICTIENNITNMNMLDKFIKCGADGFRFNFSHMDYKKCEDMILYLKENHPEILLVQDLQGNKIRISSKLKSEIKILSGQKIEFCNEVIFQGEEDEKKIPLSFKENFFGLSRGDILSLNDSDTTLKIVDILNEENLIAEVIDGGIITAGKSVNAPSFHRNTFSITPKDLKDVMWGLKRNMDIIMMPYVTNGEDIISLRRIISAYLEEGIISNYPLIFAKIECKQGFEQLFSIAKEADGIVVGRGDLIKEVSHLEFPIIEDAIICTCKKAEKPIIISNSILTSMKNKKLPNINEVNNLYNLIKKNVSGVVLCEEVMSGKYPFITTKFVKTCINTYK